MIGWLSFVVEVVALLTSLKIHMFGAGTDDALLPGNSVVAVGLTPLVEVLVKDKGGNEADFELSCWLIMFEGRRGVRTVGNFLIVGGEGIVWLSLREIRGFGAGTDDALLAEDTVMVGWSLLVAEVIACSELPKIRVLGTGTDDALLTGDGAAAVTLPPIAKGIL